MRSKVQLWMPEKIAGWGRMLPAGFFMQNAASFVEHNDIS